MARDTLGYIAVELLCKNIKLTFIAFGMLLMEMGRRRKKLSVEVEKSGQVYYPSWVYSQLNDGEETEMRDVTNEERTLVKKMIIVACWCIQMNSTDHPSMKKVVLMLETSNALPQMTPNPFISLVNPHIVDHAISKSCI